ncbi:Plasmid stabilization system protein [Marinomonas gallaica]|uniref:Plasmid stabilization system protein n=1 Tax=Marinomonas gallaica TaxID=1806667 RepID=A0A1C3JVQ9_9GAMM|nr:type II toxin-antitoxin system RelE/ParE family toxin [Marinomonas gallaica]SBT19189.1 Plasmid stabilization system protein [Marinomonas gallaica]SBT20878.1 Plasmid stabilization system protein [Marinomonas gallaica]
MILWEKDALKDRKRLYEFLYEFNPIAADKTDDLLVEKIKLLIEQPQMGVVKPNQKGRMLIIPDVSLLVLYHLDQSNIKILRILHMKQKFPT